MPNPHTDRRRLAESLRALERGDGTFQQVVDVAHDIIDEWSHSPTAALPENSADELPLWHAVWHIVAACEDSLVDGRGSDHPVLEHVAYLDGSATVPQGHTARRPK